MSHEEIRVVDHCRQRSADFMKQEVDVFPKLFESSLRVGDVLRRDLFS